MREKNNKRAGLVIQRLAEVGKSSSLAALLAKVCLLALFSARRFR